MNVREHDRATAVRDSICESEAYAVVEDAVEAHAAGLTGETDDYMLALIAATLKAHDGMARYGAASVTEAKIALFRRVDTGALLVLENVAQQDKPEAKSFDWCGRITRVSGGYTPADYAIIERDALVLLDWRERATADEMLAFIERAEEAAIADHVAQNEN